MKKPRQNDAKNFPGANPAQPLPVGSQPEIQNVQPLIPKKNPMQPQPRNSRHKVMLRK
jgi:hypothetical protein